MVVYPHKSKPGSTFIQSTTYCQYHLPGWWISELFHTEFISFVWFSGGLDLHRSALWGHEDRNCPLHEKQGEEAAPSSTACSSDSCAAFSRDLSSSLTSVRTRTTWAQRSASQPDTSRIITQILADSLETAILAQNLWPCWPQVCFSFPLRLTENNLNNYRIDV